MRTGGARWWRMNSAMCSALMSDILTMERSRFSHATTTKRRLWIRLRSRPRVAVKTKRCSLRGEEANSHQRRTAPWRKEYPLAPGLNRPSPAWWKMVSGDPDRLAELGRFGAQLIIQRAVEEEVSTFLG